MKKHNSKEAFYQRLQQLAETKKTSVKETPTRNLGTLVDYKRAADGVAYGIIKEQHLYYVKKAGLKQDPNIADFAYIGGLGNITNFQYKSLAEADKQRNMMFHTINEAITLKPNKSVGKKRLNEDKAGQEIDQAASKIGDLDAATDAAAAPAPEMPADNGEAEMAAGLEAEPAGEMPAEEPAPEGGEGMPAEMPAEEPAPEGGEEVPAPEGGEEMPAEEPAPEGGEEVPAEDPEGGEEPAIGAEDEKSLTIKEIEKTLGKLTGKIRKTELEPTDVKSYVNSFLASFKDKFDEVEIEDRKAMADKILKVVPDEDVEDLGADVPQNGAEEEVAEQQCAECGGFGKYAESRGYDSPQAFMECGEEEQGNVISGYANAHNDGMNDGDIKLVALLVGPGMLEKLKGEYGHEEYAEKLAPEVNALSEATEEDKMAQINEFWGGLKGAFNRAAQPVKQGAQAVAGAAQRGVQAVGGAVKQGAQAVKGAAQQAGQAVGQYAQGVKQAYHAGEVPSEIKKLETIAADLGKQIAALNTRLQKAGQQPVNVRSILATIQNQVGAKGAASLGKFGVAAEGMVDAGNVEVQPNVLREDDEIETEKPEGGEEEKEEVGFASDAIIGGGVVKPDGAGVEIGEPEGKGEKEIEIKDSTVNITVNEIKKQGKPFISPAPKGKTVKGKVVKEEEIVSEAEMKLRKYIRARLEEKIGLRKAKLTEGKKSAVITKLDSMIDEQFKLYESVDENFGDKMLSWMEKGSQWAEGKLKKQKELKAALDTLSIDNDGELNHWIFKTFPLDFEGGIRNYLFRTPAESKLKILQQAANDPAGIGKVKIGANNWVEYVPVNPIEAGPPSGFAQGRSRLGV